MNFDILKRPIGGLPAWAWLGIVGGGAILLVWYLRKNSSSSGSAGALGQSSSQNVDATYGGQIDPYTGVPYSIESQTNPNTGLPAYYGGQGVDTTSTTAGGTQTGGAQTFVVTKTGASLETTPHDINGGKNILTLPQGGILTFISGPTPDPGGSGKSYYLVDFNGKQGYVGSDAIAKQNTGGGPSAQQLTPYTSRNQATPYWPQMLDIQAASGVSGIAP